MQQELLDHLASETAALRDQGLFKDERVIVTPQQASIGVSTGKEVINFIIAGAVAWIGWFRGSQALQKSLRS